MKFESHRHDFEDRKINLIKAASKINYFCIESWPEMKNEHVSRISSQNDRTHMPGHSPLTKAKRDRFGHKARLCLLGSRWCYKYIIAKITQKRSQFLNNFYGKSTNDDNQVSREAYAQ